MVLWTCVYTSNCKNWSALCRALKQRTLLLKMRLQAVRLLLIYELGNGQWDIPALRTLLEDIVPRSSVFNDFVLEHDFPDIGRRVMLLNARRLHAELVLRSRSCATTCAT